MGLFGKKKRELAPLISDEELDAMGDPAVNFNSVVEYLEGLSRYEFDKLLKVVNIYRNANKDVHKVLGIKDEPTTTIVKESREEASLDEDSDIADLLEDTPPAEKPKKDKQK